MALTKIHNRMIDEGSVHVKDYGAKGDYNFSTKTGTADDAAFAAAIADAKGRSIQLGGRNNRYYLTQPLELDLLTKTIQGDGAWLVFSGASSGLRFRTSGVAGANHQDKASRTNGGFLVLGLTDNQVLVEIGNDTATNNNPTAAEIENITIRADAAVQSTCTGIRMSNDCWGVTIQNFAIHNLGTGIRYPDGVSNSGERMTFQNGIIDGSGTAVHADNNELPIYFNHVSFDANKFFLLEGGAKAFVDNFHMENSSDENHIELQGATGGVIGTFLSLSNGYFNLGNNGPRTKNPIVLGTDFTTGPHAGLSLQNVAFRFIANDNVRYFIFDGGDGHTQQCVSFKNSPSFFFDRSFTGIFMIAESRNLLGNSYFDDNSDLDWEHTINTGSGGGSYVADASAPGGTYKWRISGASGGDHEYEHKRAVRPGDQVIVSYQAQRNFVQANTIRVTVRFKDYSDAVIAQNIQYFDAGSDAGFEWGEHAWAATQLAPAGAVNVELAIRVAGATAGSVDFGYIYFDIIDTN